MITNWKISAFFLSIFAISLFFYYPSLTYYFFQDDWFVLNWAMTDPLSFFNFRTDIIYWRPLTMPIFFAINKLFFGLNPFYFHLSAFTIFFALIIAIYHLFLNLTADKKLAAFASFLYATWPIHFISLSWLSTTSYITGPFFQSLSFIFFIKFIKVKKPSRLIISFLLFLLALASSEMTIVLPAIIFIWGFLIKKENYLKCLLPYLAIDLVYLLLRFLIFPIPAQGQYQIYFNRQIIYNLLWYVGWAQGLPESFKSLIFWQLPSQSIKVITQFWQITLPATLIIILTIKIALTKITTNWRPILFGLCWLIIGLFPVITLVNHSYPIYLSFAGLGFLYIVTIAIKKFNYFYWILFCFLWLIIAFNNLQFTRATHWIRNEQAISKAYVAYVKNLIPNPSNGTTFIFKPADIIFAKQNQFVLVETEDTLRQSLNDQAAMQVIYKNSTLKSFYVTRKQSITQEGRLIEISPQGQ